MYERTYGDKYDKTLNTAEIAARVRLDIKAAIKARDLPSPIKVSVRTQYFAGGSAIRVAVTAVPAGFVILNPERAVFDALNGSGQRNYGRPPNCRTEAAYEVLSTLKGILHAYNHDGSDSQVDYFDVNFYGEPGFDWRLEKAEREREQSATLAR